LIDLFSLLKTRAPDFSDVSLSRADFQIDTPKRTYYLYAENSTEMHSWLDVLTRAKKFFEIKAKLSPGAEIRADPALFVDETPSGMPGVLNSGGKVAICSK
jgi:hypothetical protein